MLHNAQSLKKSRFGTTPFFFFLLISEIFSESSTSVHFVLVFCFQNHTNMATALGIDGNKSPAEGGHSTTDGMKFDLNLFRKILNKQTSIFVINFDFEKQTL